MASRRPRMKPAAILKPRRVQSTNQQNVDSIEDSLKSDTNESEIEKIDAKNEIRELIEIPESKSSRLDDALKVTSESASPVKKSWNVSSQIPRPFRRIMNPAVNMVGRRNLYNQMSPVHGKSPIHMKSPAHMRSPAYSYMFENNLAASPKKIEEKPNSSPKIGASANHDDEVFSPIPDHEDCFKSPSNYSRKPETSNSPYTDGFSDECGKSPSYISNFKVRQRIRPTPCFNRRNSIHGTQSESDEETTRRQRNSSISSTHSAISSYQTSQRNYFGVNRSNSRIRTESMSSNVSDANYLHGDHAGKSKRSHRSEEFQRMANAKRMLHQQMNGQLPDKSRLTMFDMIYYNPVTNPMSKPAVKSESKERIGDTSSVSSIRTIISRDMSVKSEPQVKAENNDSNQEAMPVPQLKLGPNGEIVLDEKSLVIETTGNKEAREMLAKSDIIYDDEFSGTSGFYKRHKRTKDWSADETIKFYRSLQAVGTDFSVMLQLFPNRSRRDLKLKFKKEERHNMALVNKALLHPKEFNIEELQLQFDKEDQDMQAKKAEWATISQTMAKEKKEQVAAAKKRSTKKIVSTSTRCLLEGDQIYENEFVKLPKRRRRKNDSIMLDESEHLENIKKIEYSPIKITRELPSFNEIIASRKMCKEIHEIIPTTSTSIAENRFPEEQILNAQSSDAENSHEKSLNLTENPMIVPADVINVPSDPLFTETVIERYINRNLVNKSDSEDIMNMDIIFDNVAIEEDPSVVTNPSNDIRTIATMNDVNVISIDPSIDEKITPTKLDKENDSVYIVNDVHGSPIEYSKVVITSDNIVIIPTSAISDVTSSSTMQSTMVSAINEPIPVVFNEIRISPSNEPTASTSKEIIVSSESSPIKNKIEKVKIEQSNAENHQIKKEHENLVIKRKKKPYPILIGRNKRAKNENALETKSRKNEQPKTEDEMESKPYTNETKLDGNNRYELNEVETHENEIIQAGEMSDLTSFMDSLVVVESQDPHDSTQTVYEVYFVCPETKKMSDQPLDLPAEVIERIRLSMASTDA